MNAEYDYLTPPEEGKRTADQINGAEYIEMKGIGHFPMSENYPVFKEYLQQALRIIEDRAGTPTTVAAGGAQEGNGAKEGDQDKGLLDRAKDALT
jgi:hypothetical protein